MSESDNKQGRDWQPATADCLNDRQSRLNAQELGLSQHEGQIDGILAAAPEAAAQAIVRAGLEAETPYKITMKCVTNSTPAHKWEMEIQMKIKER